MHALSSSSRHAASCRAPPPPPARAVSGSLASCSGRRASPAIGRPHAAPPPRASARRRALRAAPRAAAALFAGPLFDPAKLAVAHEPGYSPTGPPPSADAPRRYTLTHNDVTDALRLSVGPCYNPAQLDGWYVKLLRDEVLAEWRVDEEDGGSPSLHVACHISGATAWARLAPPRLRSLIFQREMALVLDTIAHADAPLLAATPALAAATVFVVLDSHDPRYNTVVPWGALGDRAAWRAPPPLAALLSSDDEWAAALEEGVVEGGGGGGGDDQWGGGAWRRRRRPQRVERRQRWAAAAEAAGAAGDGGAGEQEGWWWWWRQQELREVESSFFIEFLSAHPVSFFLVWRATLSSH